MHKPPFILSPLSLCCYVLFLVVLAIALPAMAQAAHYHAFADDRTLWGIPRAMDVLSNFPLMAAGVAIAWCLWRSLALGTLRAPLPIWWWLSVLAAAGFAATAVASSLYHLHPDDAGVFWDRLAMALVFAAIVGLAVQQALDDTSASIMTVITLAGASIALSVWRHTGNFTPWIIVQAGGMLLLLALAMQPARRQAAILSIALTPILCWYALAKLAEWGDHFFFTLTAGYLSGHSLKHVLAACAAWPLLQMLYNAKAPEVNTQAHHQPTDQHP
ncbi:hypothetical protein E9531_02565 [Lampropedia puyangensis]|uniref:Alkaline phytoceramidase n=1 Tax=Lampropedia puyangensis TaxID=1330072 RepID=A0A4S8FDX2_9BURK|nr:hypothetical protein [Lampropedia puyangensis]THU05439.1 hypothetical protein E9531_02565 [Lampropedia puyangensis]